MLRASSFVLTRLPCFSWQLHPNRATLRVRETLTASLWRLTMALTQAPTEICTPAQAPSRAASGRSASGRSSSSRGKTPVPPPKKTKRQRSQEASLTAKEQQQIIPLPSRLLRSGAAFAVTAIGLGLYGIERDSGIAMLASGGSMLLGTALTAGALLRYLSRVRHR